MRNTGYLGAMRIVVMASGSGTTFEAIANRCQDVEIEAVLCDKPGAGVIKKAHKRGIPTIVTPHEKMIDQARIYRPDLIVMAGYMRILDPMFVAEFDREIVNIHPSLLPEYKGLNTHERVLAAGEEYHGSTIHLVIDELDAGPIIEQRSIKILHGESPALLEARIHELEHVMYPEILDLIARGHFHFPEVEGEPVRRLMPNKSWRPVRY